ncbi:MAG TPA: glycerol-3-phosphate acyltransferase [Paenibacillaceae bacterium]
MTLLLLVAIGYLSGSVMYAHLLGRLVRIDLLAAGDGNPGAVNLWRNAGYRYGLAAVVLDFMKGYVPVALFLQAGLVRTDDPAVVAVAAAPVAGHLFSPFLQFRGGKGIAVTFGVWSALTHFEVSLVYAVILALLKLADRKFVHGRIPTPESNAFQVVFGLLVVSAWLYERSFPGPILWFWCVNLLLLAWAHRERLYLFYKAVGKWINS